MKKLITICMAAALILSGSCSSKEKDRQLQQAQEMAKASNEELAAAVSDRDQLLSLVNEISSGMQEIKQLENILTVSNGINESSGKRSQIQADIAAIQKTLQERRERLAELEKRLSSSSLTNNNLRQTISTLRSQIDSQTEEINSLRANLDEAKSKIGELDAAVDSLNTTVTNVTAEKDLAQQENTALTNEINTCYYAIGNKSELKSHKIIETGFLRKTKLLKGDFDQSFFTTADKRTLTVIDLNSDKAEVMTNQPRDSYTIEDVQGHKILRITNPAKFWGLSNYLVVKID